MPLSGVNPVPSQPGGGVLGKIESEIDTAIHKLESFKTAAASQKVMDSSGGQHGADAMLDIDIERLKELKSELKSADSKEWETKVNTVFSEVIGDLAALKASGMDDVTQVQLAEQRSKAKVMALIQKGKTSGGGTRDIGAHAKAVAPPDRSERASSLSATESSGEEGTTSSGRSMSIESDALFADWAPPPSPEKQAAIMAYDEINREVLHQEELAFSAIGTENEKALVQAADQKWAERKEALEVLKKAYGEDVESQGEVMIQTDSQIREALKETLDQTRSERESAEGYGDRYLATLQTRLNDSAVPQPDKLVIDKTYDPLLLATQMRRILRSEIGK